MMARVRGVIAAATCRGSMFQVRGSASTTTGVAPARTIAAAHEMIVSVGRITSSPGPSRSAVTATSSAALPLLTSAGICSWGVCDFVNPPAPPGSGRDAKHKLTVTPPDGEGKKKKLEVDVVPDGAMAH